MRGRHAKQVTSVKSLSHEPREPGRAMAGTNLTAHGIAILRALRDFAVRKEMWLRRGVRGWAFSDELPKSHVLLDQLRSFAARGLVDREDVRDALRSSPMHLHRITQAGANAFTHESGAPIVSIEPAGQLAPADVELLFVNPSASDLLAFLSVQEPGRWFSFIQIRKASDRRLMADDGRFLLSRGLVERRPSPGRGGRFVYRATKLGRGARVIDAGTSHSRVQIHVPGIVAAAEQGPRIDPAVVADMCADVPADQRPGAMGELLEAARAIHARRDLALPRWIAEAREQARNGGEP